MQQKTFLLGANWLVAVAFNLCFAQSQVDSQTADHATEFAYKVFLDKNSNGIFDVNETVIPHHVILWSDALFITNANGIFYNNYGDLSQIKSANKEFSVTTTSYNVKHKSISIGLNYRNAVNDLSINIVADNRSIQTTEATIHLICNKAFASTEPFQVKLNLPQNISVKTSSHPLFQSNSNYLLWNINPIQLENNYIIDVTLMATQGFLPLSIKYNAEVITTLADLQKHNNQSSIEQVAEPTITPNSKIVDPSGVVKTNNTLPVNITLLYTIHFQNTSSGIATNLTIVDTLPSKVAPGTFVLIGSSHSCAVQFAQNAVAFNFNNINLPDSSLGQKQSMGWVQFMVNTNNSVNLNDSIENVADIIFDLNQPIRTSEARIEFVNIAAIDEFDVDASVKIWPNPFDAKTNIELNKPCFNCHFTVYDCMGNIMDSRIINTPVELDGSFYKRGIYFYRLSQSLHTIAQGKFVKN